MKNIAADLEQRRQASLYRQRHALQSPQGTHVIQEEKCYLSFCSNDYLGLANDPRLVQALKEGGEKYGVGSGAAHLITGHSEAHHQLELALAEHTGYERALLFSTGYMANLGVISALLERNDIIFEDKLNHASLIDGARLAQARLKRYLHNDVESLQRQLNNADSKGTMVATDSVFSMDGDLAPLSALSQLCQQHHALLMVDDAHGLGVLGDKGQGCVTHCGLSPQDVPLYVGTLGKALGTFGAFVASSHDIIETLIQSARTYIYTTALPPAIAHTTLTSLYIAQQETWRREHLQHLIQTFRQQAQQLGFTLTDSSTPIQPIIIGDTAQTVATSEALKAQSILIPAIRPPTVAKGKARLRVSFSANHSEEDLQRLLNALSNALEQCS